MADGATTFVTGATGFLGPHLVWEAAAHGPVVAVDRRAPNDGSPLTEHSQWRDTSAYAVSKQSIERLMAHAVHGFGMDVVAVRPAALFGPLERPTGAREAMSGIHGLMHAALRSDDIRVHD